MSRGSKHKLASLPKGTRDEIVKDVVLGRKSMLQVAREQEVSDTSVSRFMRTVTEEERVAVLAKAAQDSKLREAHTNADLIAEFGEDTDKDLKWVLRELKDLLQSAKGDEDRMMQLGALKELRQSLMSLADLHGKLNKRMDVHLNLNESPQFIQLRQIILNVLERHPTAKHDFLDEMDKMGVIREPVLVDDRKASA